MFILFFGLSFYFIQTKRERWNPLDNTHCMQ